MPGEQAQQLVAGESHPVYPGAAHAAVLQMLDGPGSFAAGQYTESQFGAIAGQVVAVAGHRPAHDAPGNDWLSNRPGAIRPPFTLLPTGGGVAGIAGERAFAIDRRGRPWPVMCSASVMANERANAVGDRDSHRAESQLPQARTQDRATGEPADDRPAADQRHRCDCKAGGQD